MKTKLGCVVGNHVKRWMKNGLLHREDGPAVIKGSGINQVNEYWLDGCLVTASMLELHRTLTPQVQEMVGMRTVVNLDAMRVK